MRDLAFTRDWRFKAGLVVTTISLIVLALVPSQVLEPKFGARSIAFSPKTLPAVTLALMGLLGLVMALAPALSREAPSRGPPEGAPHPRVLVVMAVMVGYVAIIDQVGLIVASGIAIATLAYALGNRSPTTIAVLALAVPAFIWLVFKLGLKVFLPEGALFEGFA